MSDNTSSRGLQSLSHPSPPSDDSHESQPLLSQSDHFRRYDCLHEEENTEVTRLSNVKNDGAVQKSVNRLKKYAFCWPTLIPIIITISLIVTIFLVAFIAPSYIENYAREAVSIEPTKLLIDSFTKTGVKARVSADFRVDAEKVSDKYSRNLGRFSTWIAKEVEINQFELKLFLSDYDNLLIGTVTVPRLVVDIRNDHTTPLDFLVDITLEDINGIQMIANEWLEGGLHKIRILAEANVNLKSGLISIESQSISKLLILEGENLSTMPSYHVSMLNFHEFSTVRKKKGLAMDASVFINYNHLVEFNIPAFKFEILVQRCDAEHLIRLISVTTGAIHLYPHSGALLEVNGIVPKIPQDLLGICPDSNSSSLDILVANYIHGNNTTVFIRGSSSPTQGAPDWISAFFSRIIVPFKVPGHKYHGYVRNFSITDTDFSLPDLFADPDSKEAYPKLSGHLEAITDVPKEINFNLNVSNARAYVDVLHEGAKFGELNLHEWQEVDCEPLKQQKGPGTSLKIKTDVKQAPMKITDDGIFTDIVASLLFDRDTVFFELKAIVDIKVSTAFGEFLIKDLHAETIVPIRL